MLSYCCEMYCLSIHAIEWYCAHQTVHIAVHDMHYGGQTSCHCLRSCNGWTDCRYIVQNVSQHNSGKVQHGRVGQHIVVGNQWWTTDLIDVNVNPYDDDWSLPHSLQPDFRLTFLLPDPRIHRLLTSFYSNLRYLYVSIFTYISRNCEAWVHTCLV